MTNNKKIDIIEEAFIYYHDRNSLTKQEDNELKNLIDEIKQAINFTGSSLELKEKEVPTFDEWLKIWNWKQIGSSYTFKRGESFTDAESLLKSYTKEYNL